MGISLCPCGTGAGAQGWAQGRHSTAEPHPCPQFCLITLEISVLPLPVPKYTRKQGALWHQKKMLGYWGTSSDEWSSALNGASGPAREPHPIDSDWAGLRTASWFAAGWYGSTVYSATFSYLAVCFYLLTCGHCSSSWHAWWEKNTSLSGNIVPARWRT